MDRAHREDWGSRGVTLELGNEGMGEWLYGNGIAAHLVDWEDLMLLQYTPSMLHIHPVQHM